MRKTAVVKVTKGWFFVILFWWVGVSKLSWFDEGDFNSWEERTWSDEASAILDSLFSGIVSSLLKTLYLFPLPATFKNWLKKEKKETSVEELPWISTCLERRRRTSYVIRELFSCWQERRRQWTWHVQCTRWLEDVQESIEVHPSLQSKLGSL